MSFSIHKNNFVGGNIEKSLIPINNGVSLGSTGSRFKDIYLEKDSVYIGDVKLSESKGELIITNGEGNQQTFGGYDIKNISSLQFYRDSVPATDTFTITKTIEDITIKTALVKLEGRKLEGYHNDLYTNCALIYIDNIPSNCKRLCGGSGSASYPVEFKERNPFNNDIITWKDQYNATQESLGNYILGIYGTYTDYMSPFGFKTSGSNVNQDNIWLKSVSLSNSESNTTINFTFTQSIASELPNYLNSDITVYGLS